MRTAALAGLAALAALGPLSAAPASAQEAGRSTARPDQRVQLDFQHYYTLRELEMALNMLASAYPEYVRLESMGKSPRGRELWLLTVTRLADGDPGSKPALLVASGLGDEDLWGTEMALFTVLELVQNHERDAQVARVLSESVIYVAPCLNPDLRASVFAEEGGDEPAPERASLDRNFEIGWRAGGARAGPYPLSEPETASAAAFLLAHPNVALVQTFRGAVEDGAPAGIPDIPPADLEVYRRVDQVEASGQREGGSLRGLPGVATRGGTLLEFAYGHRGAFGFATIVAGASPGVPEVFELFPLGRRAAHATLSLAGALPRLELELLERKRLTGDLWQIDLTVQNAGALPTLSALGERRFACGPPRLFASGAEVSAAAVRRRPEGTFEVAEWVEGSLVLDQIGGGGSQTVRLIVEAEEGTELELSLESPRGGAAGATVELR